MTHTAVLENNKSSYQHVIAQPTPADPYEFAMETLALPAQSEVHPRGTTPARRTAARFALLDLHIEGGLTQEQEDDIRGAFRHAFIADDIAPKLFARVRGSSLDFSNWRPVSSWHVTKLADVDRAAKRAKREANLSARRDRDRAASMAKGAGSGGVKRQGKKGK